MSKHHRRRVQLQGERHAAHLVFDRLWQGAHNYRWVRRLAYQWLAHQLSIPYRLCHFGRFRLGTLRRVVHLCRQADIQTVLSWWDRKRGTRWLRARLHPEERIPKSSKTYYESRAA